MVVLKNNDAIKLQPYGMTLDYYPEGGGGCMRMPHPLHLFILSIILLFLSHPTLHRLRTIESFVDK